MKLIKYLCFALICGFGFKAIAEFDKYKRGEVICTFSDDQSCNEEVKKIKKKFPHAKFDLICVPPVDLIAPNKRCLQVTLDHAQEAKDAVSSKTNSAPRKNRPSQKDASVR